MTDIESSMTEVPVPLNTAEKLLRASLKECREQLAETRAVRDKANTVIRTLVEQETLLARSVAVFDKAAERAIAQHPSQQAKATS